MRWQALSIGTPPPLIAVDEAKAHLRVDHTEEDTLITALCSVVEAHLSGPDGVLSRGLVNRSFRAVYQPADFCIGGPASGGRFWMHGFALVHTLSLVEVLTGGVYVELPAGDALLFADDFHAYVTARSGASWPVADAGVPDPVRITVVSGYGNLAAHVPAPIRHAALLMLGFLYQNREANASDALNSGPVLSLLSSYRLAV